MYLFTSNILISLFTSKKLNLLFNMCLSPVRIVDRIDIHYAQEVQELQLVSKFVLETENPPWQMYEDGEGSTFLCTFQLQ